jgi:hypothetical protein
MYYLFTRICWRESIRVSALSFGGAGDTISHCCSLFEIALDSCGSQSPKYCFGFIKRSRFHFVCFVAGGGTVGGWRSAAGVAGLVGALLCALRDYFCCFILSALGGRLPLRAGASIL